MDGWDRKAAADTISNYLDATEIGNMQAVVNEAITALNNGETLSADVIANLQQISNLVNLMDSIGVGENILSGIAEGMTQAGTDQPFRIYRAVPELTKITVYARQVFYDLMDNMLKSYKPATGVTGAAVVQNISSKCLTEHDFTFYSDVTSTADEVEFENMNPVDALLGEGGVVEKYDGELARDWFDAFVVKRVGTDTDVQIREGKNLLGIP